MARIERFFSLSFNIKQRDLGVRVKGHCGAVGLPGNPLDL